MRKATASSAWLVTAVVLSAHHLIQDRDDRSRTRTMRYTAVV